MVYSPAQRCLDVLELLADAPEGMALSAVGARLALPKSAAYRFLSLLERRGYVSQDAATQHYRLTFKLPALGFRFLGGTHLTEACQPVLDALATRTGELARLAVVEGDNLTWVAKAQGALSGLRYDPDTGHEVVLHATATGKAWLASLPEARALAIVAAHGFGTPSRFGPRVIHTVTQLKRELRETRRRGWGEAVEEGAPGVAAVAAVIRSHADPASPVVGTVSVAGPLARLDDRRRVEVAHDTLAAAREMTAVWPLRAQFAPAQRAA